MGQAVAFQIKSFTFAGKHIYQDIRMKKVLKLAGGFMVGACIGFVGVIGVRVLVLGDSFDGLHSKFAETGMLETVGVSLLTHTDSAVLHLPASTSARRRASCLRTGNRLPLRLLPHLQPYLHTERREIMHQAFQPCRNGRPMPAYPTRKAS